MKFVNWIIFDPESLDELVSLRSLGELGELLAQKPMYVVSKEHDLKEAIGALFVPKGVWRVGSAVSISWVHVLGLNHICVSLSESRQSSGEDIPVRQNHSSDLVWNEVVKLWNWDEEFLPEEGIEYLHDHSEEFLDDVVHLSSGELNVLDCDLKLWKVLIDNEISIFLRDDSISKFGNRKLSDKPRQDDGENRRNQSSESNEVNVR